MADQPAPVDSKPPDAPALADLGGPIDEAYPIRIAADGTWFHEGRPIRRHALVKLFSTVLSRDDTGDHWLITPAERGRIQVEDAAFIAVLLRVEDQGTPNQRLIFTTNVEREVAAGPELPISLRPDPKTGGPRPYLACPKNVEALIARPVYYQLAELLEEGPGGRLGLRSNGTFFPFDLPEDPA